MRQRLAGRHVKDEDNNGVIRWSVRWCLAFFLLGCTAMPSSKSPGDVTLARLRALHGAIAAYRATYGELPGGLDLICQRDERLCGLETPDRWTRDGWGTPIGFAVDGGEYELRSNGPDLVNKTADDIVFSSLDEQMRVKAFSGCYLATDKWGRLPHDTLVLDTVIHPSGDYDVSPKPEGYFAAWQPITDDSIVVYWIRVDVGLSLHLRRENNGLVGVAKGVGRSRPWKAQRIPCRT